MADKKISALTAASTPLAGTEVLPIVQSSTTVKVSVSNLTDGRSIKFSSANVGPNYLSISGAIIDAGKDQNSPTRFGISNQNTGASAVAGIDLEAAGGGWQIDVPADVVTFVNPLIGKFGGTEKFRFTSDGNYVPKVAAKGINFTANTGAAGMTSQLLNWYEEGTFTATLTATTPPTTPPTATARYTRVGRLVTVHIDLSNVDTSGASGDYSITGLPFTSANNGVSTVGAMQSYNFSSDMGCGFLQPNSTTISIVSPYAASITTTAAGAGKYVRVTMSYIV